MATSYTYLLYKPRTKSPQGWRDPVRVTIPTIEAGSTFDIPEWLNRNGHIEAEGIYFVASITQTPPSGFVFQVEEVVHPRFRIVRDERNRIVS